jgi:KUP system potassium uptake protein
MQRDRTRIQTSALLGVLGVVYGDIGTSPLYAFREAAKASSGGGAPSPDVVLGIISLILWALIVIVSLKYAILLLKADNHGEGGIVALIAVLGLREASPGTWGGALLLAGLVGAALLYGDGAITPAISVLSAVEGLEVAAPRLAPFVVPITVGILIALFLVQYKGTGFIGKLFGPVMLAWFLLLGILGVGNLIEAPTVLSAISPQHAVHFLINAPPAVSFAVLGAAFLAVTGGEAMYADMGHFGRKYIRLGWFGIVLPCLVLNYFGQGALLLNDPAAIENTFFRLGPDWSQYLLVLFATAATVIASQSIITGVFSLTQQAIQLGFLPSMRVLHTKSEERGQIYIPLVNWLLALVTLTAVVGFGSSERLAGAYGIAVSLLMALTTILATLIALRWGFNPVLIAVVNGFFLLIDLIFLSANSVKLLEGGWFPLTLAAVVVFLMLTWRTGQRIIEGARSELRQDESTFLKNIASSPPVRLPGTAAFLTPATSGIPLILAHHMKHTRALHERVLFVSIRFTELPRQDLDERFKVEPLTSSIARIILYFGFMETPDVPAALELATERGAIAGYHLSEMSYYVGRETLIPTRQVPGMAQWREGIYAFVKRNAERSAAYFCIPAKQVIEIGIEIEI